MILLFYPILSAKYDYMKYPWLPMTILALGKSLAEQRYEVLLIDERVQSWKDTVDKYIDKLLFVGVSAMTGSQIEYGLRFSQYIKSKKDIPIVWGGEHPSIFPEQVVKHEAVDYVVCGRGEGPIIYLAECFSKGRYPPPIIHGEVIDLSIFFQMPLEKIKLDRYLNPQTRRISLQSGTNCINHCAFCRLGKQQYTFLPADQTYEMTEYYIKKYDLWRIRFFDPNFFASKSRVMEFCDKILTHNLKLEWSGFGDLVSLNKYSKQDYKIIKRSGCWRYHIGNESGSKKILKVLNKPHRPHHLFDFLGKVQAASISICYMFGIPTETVEDLRLTIEQINKVKDLRDDLNFNINFFRPYPATPIWDECVKMGFPVPQTLEEWGEDISVCRQFPDFPWNNFSDEYKRLFNNEINPLIKR